MLARLLILRIGCALVWGGVLARSTPALIRTLGGRARHYDALWSIHCFIALAILGFIARWLIWRGAQVHMQPGELATWAGMYVLTILSGSILTIAVGRYERGDR